MTSQSTALRSRAWVEVDLDALARNALQILLSAGPGVGLIPMVKADAYGLGMTAVVDTLARALPEAALYAFGVATVAEGAALRAHGWKGAVLVFSPVPPGEFEPAAAAGLTLCLSDAEGVRRWAAAARQAGRPLAFHTEIDTGMGRSGFRWDQAGVWGAAVAALARENLEWAGCFTHFHSADEPDLGPTRAQWQRLEQSLATLPPQERPAHRVVHTSNSAAALRVPGMGELVRPGIFLYGGGVGAAVRPAAVATLRARLALVRQVEPGTTLGYGATYTARGTERWGTLAIGYGDGLPRNLGPAGGEALIVGERVPIIGRISMDVTVVDLTRAPTAHLGAVATLIGADGAERITVDEVASRCGTISYEILTGLSPRLPRLRRSVDA